MYQQEVVRVCQGAADKEAGSYASNIIGANTGEERSLKKEMGDVLSAQGKEMGEIKFNLAALSAQMAVMMEKVKKRGKGSPKGEKRVSFQETKGALNYKGATHEA